MIFLSLPEVINILNVNIKTVMSLIRSGQLQAYQFGQEIRIEIDDLKSYIERAKIMGNSNDINDLIQKSINKASSYEAACESIQQLLIDSQGMPVRTAEAEACRLVMRSEAGRKLFEASEAGRAAKKAGNLYA